MVPKKVMPSSMCPETMLHSRRSVSVTGRTMKFERNSMGVMSRYITLGRPGGKSWEARKCPTPCSLMPAPMKVT